MGAVRQQRLAARRAGRNQRLRLHGMAGKRWPMSGRCPAGLSRACDGEGGDELQDQAANRGGLI